MEGSRMFGEKAFALSKKENAGERSLLESGLEGGRDAYRDVWTRVSEKALRIVYKDRGLGKYPEKLKRVQDILMDPDFKEKAVAMWRDQAMRNKLDPNPEKQDELWAVGLSIRLKDSIDD